MGLKIDSDKNITIKQDDAVSLQISMVGSLKAEVDDVVVVMVKENVSDIDGDAVVTKNITVTEEGKAQINIPSSETSLLTAGTYYWSAKLTQSSNQYTIIPDDGDDSFPTFTVSEVLIDG